MADTQLFLDIETLGIAPGSAIWEVAAARFEDGLLVDHGEWFVGHDPDQRDPTLPQSFLDDYAARYDPDDAVYPATMLDRLSRLAEGRAIVCGSNPRFDMDRIEALAAEHGVPAPGWHYHPNDVPGLALGYLWGKGIHPAPPHRSDFLSQCVGVDPRDYDRHTAAGDVWWCRAVWEAIGGR
ncbi:hypothetical protein ACQ856_18185 [Mycolicibacterium psychrotolerans]|uniref:hypothetical protein n=1 Tax=Mycolicibacterium psychrotolerans TaxID=216929 RepID=UPI003D67BAFE